MVPLETVASQGLAAFTVLPQVSMRRDTEEICVVPGKMGRQNWKEPGGLVRAWQGGKVGWADCLLNMSLQNLLGFGLTRSH